MQIPLIDLKAQYATLRPEIDEAVAGVLARGDFILGGAVSRFETAFASYLDVPHCVGVANGTDALALALRALGVGEGDEVIVPAMTFIATALAVSMAGARPVLADIDPVTHNLDPARVEERISGRTRAIMPVHLYGRPAAMAALTALAKKYGVMLVEDAAQAHAAKTAGRRCGAFGVAAGFSFYPGKNLGAYGDGGALVTSDDGVAERVRMLRDYGQREKYVHLVKGGNSRLDTLQAAVLEVKLRHLDDWSRARMDRAVRYGQALAGVPELVLPQFDRTQDLSHVFHLYVIRARERDALLQHLKADGIGASIHYPIPLHLLPAYSDLGHGVGDFPEAERAAAEVLSLPLYPEMTDEQVDRVAASVRAFYAS